MPRSTQPNILLIVFDTARADAFEPYGGEAGASPTVAQLARRGSALPAAYAPANWTVPSHVSMLSGLLPRQTGLTQAPGGKAVNCRPFVEALRHRLLPEVLRKAGYSTRGVSANAWISEATGFATGFEDFKEVVSTRERRIEQEDVRGRLRWLIEGARARSDDGAAAAERTIRGWMDEGSQPFFWFVNLVECHSPYLPPRPYNDLGVVSRLRAAGDVRRYQTTAAVWQTCAGRRPVPASALGRMRHLYGRSIRALDDWLARILEQMDRHAILDDTLVIVTSDHGENLGESGLIGHAFSLDERLIHIPLIVSGPAAFSSEKAVSLVSLPALVAEAVGLPDHPWQGSDTDEGVVVAQYDPLTGPSDPRIERVAREWALDSDAMTWFTSGGTAATDGTFKLVRERGAERLYDLRTDPRESAPVTSPGGNGIVHRLRAALEKAETVSPVVFPEAPDASSIEENAELEERLRLLGYL